MGRTDDKMERICKVYLNLNDDEKRKVIKLAEGLLDSQNIRTDEEINTFKDNKSTDLKIV